MTDREILLRALDFLRGQTQLAPSDVGQSMIAQLEYLLANIADENDGARLPEIILGVQTVREFDGDQETQDILFEAVAVVQKLVEGYRA